MVIKVDKSEEFKKTGRKLISEYDGHEYYDEKEEEKPQFLNENSKTTWKTWKMLIWALIYLSKCTMCPLKS